VVPAGTIVVPALAGAMVNVPALQIVLVKFGITGVGETVTVVVKGSPTHEPAAPEEGVTVYTIV
jgi:hypothetical protein